MSEPGNWSDPLNWAPNLAPTGNDLERDDVLIFPATGVTNFGSFNDIGIVAAAQIRVFGNDYNISGGTVR